MKNKVEILSPGPGCWKTKKIIKSIKQFFMENNIDAEFNIISNTHEFIKYRTWILPTIIINNKVVARGYRPANEIIGYFGSNSATDFGVVCASDFGSNCATG